MWSYCSVGATIELHSDVESLLLHGADDCLCNGSVVFFIVVKDCHELMDVDVVYVNFLIQPMSLICIFVVYLFNLVLHKMYLWGGRDVITSHSKYFLN